MSQNCLCVGFHIRNYLWMFLHHKAQMVRVRTGPNTEAEARPPNGASHLRGGCTRGDSF